MRIKAFKLLPEDADGDVGWALDQCVTRQSLTMTAAFEALVERLAAKGIEAPTRSSFHRLVMEVREQGVPARYQPSKPTSQPGDWLTALIDQRLDELLKARGL